MRQMPVIPFGRTQEGRQEQAPAVRCESESFDGLETFQAVGLDLVDGNASQPSEFRAATPPLRSLRTQGCQSVSCLSRSLVMKGTKILWGQALLVGAVLLAFIWAATERTAWRLAFQPELGQP
jgi:hypothetical protein